MKYGAKTHQCPYCGNLLRIEEAQIIYRARSGKEAREVIRRLTTPRGLKREQ
ncbi:MAG: DUF1922 domain-containing protein [Crenarchaeota archaeon]|nr:DUF1922 domain-containing protein [Thermoproteota archaeon]